MSFLVVILVSLVVFFYVRSTRRARQAWLQKLDLPGRWHGQTNTGEADTAHELTLHGGLDKGDFVYQFEDKRKQGQWHLKGHTLSLNGEQGTQSFDLHFFKAGHIGLEDKSGSRLLLNKQTSNVIPLRARSGAE